VFDSPQPETPGRRSWRPKRVIDIKPASLDDDDNDDDDVPGKEEHSSGFVEHGETIGETSLHSSFTQLRAFNRPDVFDSPQPNTPGRRSWRPKQVIDIKPGSLDDDDDVSAKEEQSSGAAEHGEKDTQRSNSFISQQSAASTGSASSGICTFYLPPEEQIQEGERWRPWWRSNSFIGYLPTKGIQEEERWKPWCTNVIKVYPE
jgi:hypothetical protein